MLAMKTMNRAGNRSTITLVSFALLCCRIYAFAPSIQPFVSRTISLPFEKSPHNERSQRKRILLLQVKSNGTSESFPNHRHGSSLDAATVGPPTGSLYSHVDWNTILTKILNATVLIVCFGFASNQILNIDAGITRGWTQSEIAMRIPLDNWASYEEALEAAPVVTKTLINVVIYLLGDWLSQTLFRGENALEFDLVRTLRNGFVGLCFGPLVHLYYEFSDFILPVEGGMTNRACKIFMDQTIYLSVKCSIYLAAIGTLSGKPWEEVKDTVKTRIGPICITAWKFWPLVHCITYGLIPARHRILWVNSVDLVWNAILATMAGEKKPEEEQEQEVVVVPEQVESLTEKKQGEI